MTKTEIKINESKIKTFKIKWQKHLTKLLNLKLKCHLKKRLSLAYLKY